MKGRGLVIALALVVALLAAACVAPTPAPATPSPTPTPTGTPTPTPAATPAPTATPAPAAGTVQLQWLGQSCFLLTSSQGTKLLIDPPNPPTGYSIDPISGVDVVLVTHEHSDHNYVALATGSPLILRGLSATGWNTIDQKVKDIRIYSISPAIPIYHDTQQGAQRGRNTIFVLEVDGLRLAHLGDLGHLLTPEAVQAIGPLDVLMIPVGGFYTIDAAGATEVVGQLGNPKVVLPMHYKTPKTSASWRGTVVDPFLEGKTVQRPNSTTIRLSKATLPAQSTVVVLNYE
jgi:L-ascorbate metabolism protein UlaG (beta-lactamase superfamily)